MASISKISTRIVADARQFNSTLAASEQLAEGTFARLGKLQFKPGVARIKPTDKAQGRGPIDLDAQRGDSLQALYDLIGRVQKRGVDSAAAVNRAWSKVSWKPAGTVRVDSSGAATLPTLMQRLRGARTSLATPVKFKELEGPLQPGQKRSYRADVPDDVRNRALFPRDMGMAETFKARTLAVYKAVAGAANLAAFAVGRVFAGVNVGRNVDPGEAWRASFGRLIPTVRQAYAVISKPVYLTYRVVRVPVQVVRWTLRRVGASLAATARAAGNTLSSMVPSPKYAAIGALASVGVSTYQFHEYAEKVTKASIATREFAVSSGATGVAIQSMQYALRYMGQDAAGAIAALKTVEQLQVASKVGDYGTSDLLARLGGKAGEALKTSDDLLYTMTQVNEAIASQGSGVRAVVLATHVYGDNAERVLRYALLTNKARAELADRGFAAGNFLPNDAIVTLQQMSLMVDRVQLSFEGLTTKAVAAFAPMVLAGLEMANTFMAGLNADKIIADIKGVALQIVAFVVNLPSYFSIASDYVVLAIGRIGEAADKLQVKLLRLQASVVGAIPGGGGSDAAANLTAQADKIEADLSPDRGNKNRTWYSQMALDALKSIEATKASLITADQIQGLVAIRARLAGAQQVDYDRHGELMGLARKNKPLIDGALQTAREVEQPFEKLKARLNALDLMRGLKGNMSDGTFGRAVLKAFNEAEAAMQLTDIRLPGLARKDSAESVSAINRSEVEYRLKVADTPAQRQLRVLEQSRDILATLERYALAAGQAQEERQKVSLPK